MTKDNEELYTALQMQMQSFQTQMDDVKETIRSINEKQDKICTLASNVEVAKNDIEHLQTTQETLSNKFEDVKKQVTDLSNEPYKEYKSSKTTIKNNVLGYVLSNIITAIITALFLFFKSGKL